jgi:hypothetical protein
MMIPGPIETGVMGDVFPYFHVHRDFVFCGPLRAPVTGRTDTRALVERGSLRPADRRFRAGR